jgi:hypothetical protein
VSSDPDSLKERNTPWQSGEIEALREELARLRDRVAELEERVDPSGSTLPPAARDYRDARVLEAITAGETVSARDLHALYREHTDIRSKQKRRDRVKDLVTSETFVDVGTRRWRYFGPGGEQS